VYTDHLDVRNEPVRESHTPNRPWWSRLIQHGASSSLRSEGWWPISWCW
jgi:hypothetical protein